MKKCPSSKNYIYKIYILFISERSDDGGEEHDPIPDFQPIIPLPEEIDVVTGEEREDILYESRCKLYRYVEKEWKERGLGQLKILHNKDTGRARLVMRREQVSKHKFLQI